VDNRFRNEKDAFLKMINTKIIQKKKEPFFIPFFVMIVLSNT